MSWKKRFIGSADVRTNTDGVVAVAPHGRMLTIPWPATVDATAGGKTLAQLKGAPLHADIRQLGILIHDASADVRMGAAGSTGGSSGRISSQWFGVDKTFADTLALFCSAGTEITVFEEG